MGLANVEFKEN